MATGGGKMSLILGLNTDSGEGKERKKISKMKIRRNQKKIRKNVQIQ